MLSGLWFSKIKIDIQYRTIYNNIFGIRALSTLKIKIHIRNQILIIKYRSCPKKFCIRCDNQNVLNYLCNAREIVNK